MSRLIAAALFGFVIAACAGTWESSPDGGSRNVITAAEIRAIEARTAYDAVQKLRPRFLRRGRVSLSSERVSYPVVYLDGLEFGGVDDLRRIRGEEVYRIEYLSGPDATLRFGTGHSGGVLLVSTRPPQGGG